MIIGDPSVFAIESAITAAYKALNFRALGFFTLHIGGVCYGVREPDASMLACSLGEVEERISRRGTHTATFATGVDGERVADVFRDAVYAPGQEEESFFGMSQSVFTEHLYSNHLVWAPDGDEAFDDSSFVLQFDLGDRVRLIGFRSTQAYHHDHGTLRDISLDADVFYGVLREWRKAFLSEWARRPKISEAEAVTLFNKPPQA